LRVPANRKDLIHAIEAVTHKADVRLTASIGRNRPKPDIHFLYKDLFEEIYAENLWPTKHSSRVAVSWLLEAGYWCKKNAIIRTKSFWSQKMFRLIRTTFNEF